MGQPCGPRILREGPGRSKALKTAGATLAGADREAGSMAFDPLDIKCGVAFTRARGSFAGSGPILSTARAKGTFFQIGRLDTTPVRVLSSLPTRKPKGDLQ